MSAESVHLGCGAHLACDVPLIALESQSPARVGRTAAWPWMARVKSPSTPTSAVAATAKCAPSKMRARRWCTTCRPPPPAPACMRCEIQSHALHFLFGGSQQAVASWGSYSATHRPHPELARRAWTDRRHVARYLQRYILEATVSGSFSDDRMGIVGVTLFTSPHEIFPGFLFCLEAHRLSAHGAGTQRIVGKPCGQSGSQRLRAPASATLKFFHRPLITFRRRVGRRSPPLTAPSAHTPGSKTSWTKTGRTASRAKRMPWEGSVPRLTVPRPLWSPRRRSWTREPTGHLGDDGRQGPSGSGNRDLPKQRKPGSRMRC